MANTRIHDLDLGCNKLKIIPGLGPSGVLDPSNSHCSRPNLPTFPFQLANLPNLELAPRAWAPRGPKFPKIGSWVQPRCPQVTSLPHLGPTFLFLLSLKRHKENMMFWLRSKRLERTESLAKSRLRSEMLIVFSSLWE